MSQEGIKQLNAETVGPMYPVIWKSGFWKWNIWIQSNDLTFQLYFGIIWKPLSSKTRNKGFISETGPPKSIIGKLSYP